MLPANANANANAKAKAKESLQPQLLAMLVQRRLQAVAVPHAAIYVRGRTDDELSTWL